MKKNLLKLVSIFAVLFSLTACTKDEVKSGNRQVKYEITGNFTGTFIVVATTNTDNAEVIEVTKLPWKLEFEAKPSITFLTIGGSGTNGIGGQKVTVKTYLGGKEVATGGGTAISAGVISFTSNYLL